MIHFATVEKIETRSDKTIKIVIGTQEVTPSEMAELFGYSGQLVKFYLTDKNVTREIIDNIDTAEVDIAPTVKSPSQRLRGVLYRLYEVDNEGYQDFNLFYLNKMERIIDWIKQKLD